MKPITKNTLFYGDNLFIVREYINDESVDLIYLDPPFNSSRNYNVLFKDEHGTDSEAQITAFEDTWHYEQRSLCVDQLSCGVQKQCMYRMCFHPQYSILERW